MCEPNVGMALWMAGTTMLLMLILIGECVIERRKEQRRSCERRRHPHDRWEAKERRHAMERRQKQIGKWERKLI